MSRSLEKQGHCGYCQSCQVVCPSAAKFCKQASEEGCREALSQEVFASRR